MVNLWLILFFKSYCIPFPPQAVYTKYLSKKFLKVAAMEECKGARLSQLAEAASTVQ